MRSRTSFILRAASCVAGLALLLTFPNHLGAQEADQSAMNEGARVYGTTCGRCHNPRSPLERDDRDWITIINHMRVRANLTGKEVRSVLAFLQATNTDPRRRTPLIPQPLVPGEGAGAPEISAEPPSTDPQVIAQGKLLTEQRACLGCHVIGSAGGQVGPSLNRAVAQRGPQFVRQKLVDPTVDNASSMMPNLGLAAQEIEAILAYLNTLKGK
jgi:mono/diheme cytochrome c family protein